MSELRYPPAALRSDYARAGIGLALTLGPAAYVAPGSWALWVLLPAATLFLAFAWRTWDRHRTRVVVDSEGISLFSARRVSLRWKNIDAVRLSYYALKPDRTGGWMQLTLKGVDPQQGGARRMIRVDSALDGFDTVARHAAHAVAANDIRVNDTTRANLGALDSDGAGFSAGRGR